MILARISDTNHSDKGFNLGIKISQWIKDQGLEYRKDFEWWLVHLKYGREPVVEVHIRFNDEHESVASLLNMMWIK